MKHTIKIFDIDNDCIVNSDCMKIAVAAFFRYNRGCEFTAIEFQRMDVCAVCNDLLTEIEIKISKNDLKNELKSRTKKIKHQAYKENLKRRNKINPHMFYFAITKELYKDRECIKIIEQLNDNYGIIVVEDIKHLDIVKYPKRLHKDKIKQKFKDKITARLSSDNIVQRYINLNNKKSTE